MPQVTAQRQTSIVDDAGNIVQVMAVTAKSDKGVTFTIDVPIAQYNKPNVEKLILERSATIDDVHAIGNP